MFNPDIDATASRVNGLTVADYQRGVISHGS